MTWSILPSASDADNLAFAILAKSLEVPRLIVRMRDPAYENAYKVAGVDSIVRVTDLMVNQMMIDIENPQVRRITTIGGGRANIFLVVVPHGAKAASMSIKDIAASRDFPSQCDFIAVYNPEKETFVMARGDQVIEQGDELFLVTTAGNIDKAADFLTAKT